MSKELPDKILILQTALRIAGKYAREHIPAELDTNYLEELVDGDSDPNGKRYVQKWLIMALNELEKSEG